MRERVIEAVCFATSWSVLLVILLPVICLPVSLVWFEYGPLAALAAGGGMFWAALFGFCWVSRRQHDEDPDVGAASLG